MLLLPKALEGLLYQLVDAFISSFRLFLYLLQVGFLVKAPGGLETDGCGCSVDGQGCQYGLFRVVG